MNDTESSPIKIYRVELNRTVRSIGTEVLIILAAYFFLNALSLWADHALQWHYYQQRLNALHQLLTDPGAKDLFPAPVPNPDRYRRQPPPADDSLHFFSIKDSSLAMRVYLTAAYQRQKEMRQYADQLRSEGVEVVSVWHDLDSPSSDGFSGIGDDRLAWLAMLDLQQLSGANVLASFSDKYADPLWGYSVADLRSFDSRKHIDAGMAIALGKRVLLVGPNENCYHALPDVEHFPAWPECFTRILELRGTDAMTTREAAAEARTTVKQITMWIRDGSLPAAKRKGHYVIGRNDLDRRKAQHLRARADALTEMNSERLFPRKG